MPPDVGFGLHRVHPGSSLAKRLREWSCATAREPTMARGLISLPYCRAMAASGQMSQGRSRCYPDEGPVFVHLLRQCCHHSLMVTVTTMFAAALRLAFRASGSIQLVHEIR